MVHGIFFHKWAAVRRAFLAVLLPAVALVSSAGTLAHSADHAVAYTVIATHAAHTVHASQLAPTAASKVTHSPNQTESAALVRVVAGQTAPQTRAEQGDVIPQDFLELEKKRCMDGCTAFNEEGLCVSLCTCSVDQFKTRLTFPDYLALSVEMIEDRVSDKNRKLLDTIARYCVDAYEKALATEAAKQNQPEVGSAAKPAPSPTKPDPQ